MEYNISGGLNIQPTVTMHGLDQAEETKEELPSLDDLVSAVVSEDLLSDEAKRTAQYRHRILTSVQQTLSGESNLSNFFSLGYHHQSLRQLIEDFKVQFPDSSSAAAMSGALVMMDHSNSVKRWNSMGIERKRLFYIVAQEWLLHNIGSEALVANSLSRIFGLGTQLVNEVLHMAIPAMPESSERKASDIITEMARLSCGEVHLVTNVRADPRTYFKDVDISNSDQSLMLCTFSHLYGIANQSDSLSGICNMDYAEGLITYLTEITSDRGGRYKRDEVICRPREMIAAYLSRKVLSLDAPWRRYVDFGSTFKNTTLRRFKVRNAMPMKYGPNYPDSYQNVDVFLELGSDVKVTGYAHMAKGVTHPFLPRHASTQFTVIQVKFEAHTYSFQVLKRLLERRVMSLQLCSINVIEKTEDGSLRLSCRIGYDVTYFLDDECFVFIYTKLHRVLLPRGALLISYALPVVLQGGVSIGLTAPTMIIPIIIYGSLKRSGLVYNRKRRELMRRHGDDFKEDMISRSIDMRRELMHADMTYSGMRVHLATMLTIAYRKAGLTVHTGLSDLAKALLGNNVSNTEEVDRYYELNYSIIGIDQRQILSRIMTYFHVISTLKVYTQHSKIFEPPNLGETFDSLANVDATITHLDSIFGDDANVDSSLSLFLSTNSLDLGGTSIDRLLRLNCQVG